jgi:DNA-binding Xre family transcriptional regulator
MKVKIYFDLRRVFQGKIPPLKELSKETGITENGLKHLLDVDATTINQSNLNRVCNYLLRVGLVHESDLPDLLFSKRYDSFWPLLSDRHHIEMVTGSRRDEKDGLEVVSAADSILQCNLLYELTHDAAQGRQSTRKLPRRVIDSWLVEAWDFEGANHTDVMQKTRKLYRGFDRKSGDRGLVLFGSIKSNPLFDCTFANCFSRARPFQPEDDVAKPGERSCPVMLRYRQKDPTPPSCCGGVQLSKEQPGKEPGIYYEVELGKEWAHIPSNDRSDSALVFFRIEPQGKRLEMALGGFSGRATRCLAHYFRNEDVASFWPPVFSDRGLDVGVFVVKFTFRPSRKGKSPKPAHLRITNVEVTPLAKEVLVDRVKPAKGSRPRSAPPQHPRILA